MIFGREYRMSVDGIGGIRTGKKGVSEKKNTYLCEKRMATIARYR